MKRKRKMTEPVPAIRPEPGRVQHLAPGLRVVLAPNPSPMTLHGTNTYLLGEGSVAVIDPGPDHAPHLDAILAALAPGEEPVDVEFLGETMDGRPLIWLHTSFEADRVEIDIPAGLLASGAPGPLQDGEGVVFESLVEVRPGTFEPPGEEPEDTTTGGGASTGDDSGASGDAGSGAATATGGDSDGAAAGDGEGGGCGCASTSPTSTSGA